MKKIKSYADREEVKYNTLPWLIVSGSNNMVGLVEFA